MYTKSSEYASTSLFIRQIRALVSTWQCIELEASRSFLALKSWNNHLLYKFQSTILSPLGTTTASTMLHFWVPFSVLVALWQWHLTLTTPTSCPVYISISSNKYSIVEQREPNLKLLALLFLYIMLNMFRMLLHPSSGACDSFVELFHGLHWSVRNRCFCISALI